jgi:hypothetical protein
VPATDIPATELAAVVRAVRTRTAPDRPRPQRFAAFGLGLAILLHIAGSHAWTSSTALVGGSEENRMLLTARGLAVVSSLALSSGALAQTAVQWRVEDGGNGHWYALREAPTGDAAMALASSLGGHLATITSSQENTFVLQLFVPAGRQWAWLGLRQLPDQSQPAAGWHWTTGEPLGYLNWTSHDGAFPTGAPDDTPCAIPPWGIENNQANQGVMQGDGRWDDLETGLPTCGSPEWSSIAVIEWSSDCNNDGIVDYGQILRYQLVDDNLNNIPDCCESKAGCASEPVEWRVAEGGNGHWYAFTEDYARWPDARAQAQAMGGDLATITTAAENGFLTSSFAGRRFWLGGRRSQSNFSVFEWVTGEPWSYSSWAPGEPNTCNPCGEAQFVTCGNGLWDDTGLVVNATPDHPGYLGLVEFSADCNSDGVVDFGQIRSGELIDTNGNNIPDSCETTILVPSQFPTIQAAIDSVPVGVARTIFVAGGVYSGAFRLNGKNVIIRGASDGSTILDGTGLTTSIAQCVDNEPSTAGFEDLVFRNGTSGTPFPTAERITVGGAVYAQPSSIFIRSCRFENCRADYGGAVYQKAGTLRWESCVFVNNTANVDGGAALIYNTTGSITDSSFTGNRSGVFGPGSGSAIMIVGSNGDGETVLMDSCTVTNNYAGDSGSAIEIYEHAKFHPVVARIANTLVSGNISGDPVLSGAAGLRVVGQQSSCVLSGTTSICSNAPFNVDGPFLLEVPASVCDCLADLNGDGVVSGGDLGLLLNAWGPTAPSGAGDVNHDGLVDGADLALMLNSWGFCP